MCHFFFLRLYVCPVSTNCAYPCPLAYLSHSHDRSNASSPIFLMVSEFHRDVVLYCYRSKFFIPICMKFFESNVSSFEINNGVQFFKLNCFNSNRTVVVIHLTSKDPFLRVLSHHSNRAWPNRKKQIKKVTHRTTSIKKLNNAAWSTDFP